MRFFLWKCFLTSTKRSVQKDAERTKRENAATKTNAKHNSTNTCNQHTKPRRGSTWLLVHNIHTYIYNSSSNYSHFHTEKNTKTHVKSAGNESISLLWKSKIIFPANGLWRGYVIIPWRLNQFPLCWDLSQEEKPTEKIHRWNRWGRPAWSCIQTCLLPTRGLLNVTWNRWNPKESTWTVPGVLKRVRQKKTLGLFSYILVKSLLVFYEFSKTVEKHTVQKHLLKFVSKYFVRHHWHLMLLQLNVKSIEETNPVDSKILHSVISQIQAIRM